MDDVTPGDGPEWIGLGEAARRLGVTRAAIYGRIERKTLTARPKGNRGLEVLWPPPQRHHDVTHNDQDDVMAALVATIQERLDRTEGEAAKLRGQVADLQAERDRLMERNAASRERAAKAEGEVLPLREALADLSARLDRAEALLALPWWKRLFG